MISRVKKYLDKKIESKGPPSKKTAKKLGGGLSVLFGEWSSIRSSEELREYVISQASSVSQKCSIEFSRVKGGVQWSKLFQEAVFIEELRICQWESYCAVLSDVLIVTCGALREQTKLSTQTIERWLNETYISGLSRYSVPSYRQERGWESDINKFVLRIHAQVSQDSKISPHKMGQYSADACYGTLPFHASLISQDMEVVLSYMRLSLCSLHENLHKLTILSEVERDILRQEDDKISV